VLTTKAIVEGDDLWMPFPERLGRTGRSTRRIDYWFVKRGEASVLVRDPPTLDVCGADSLAPAEAGEAGAMCLSDHRPVEVTFVFPRK
jgi:hypothetical protein